MFLKLLSGKGIKKHGLALLSGPKQVAEVLREFPEKCSGVLLAERMRVPAHPSMGETGTYELAPELFREVDLFGTDHPILLVRAAPFEEWDPMGWPAGCTLFVPFQDPANVGAVIRTGAAFGVSQVVLLEEAAHPFLPKSMRAAGSCLFRVPMVTGPSIRDLHQAGVPLITLSPRGKDMAEYRFPGTFGLIPGLEGPGLPANLMELDSLSIPMGRNVESLNAALATGIALYVWRSGKPFTA